jgi:pimeloyl-ACP methyl ester carboxylesterase
MHRRQFLTLAAGAMGAGVALSALSPSIRAAVAPRPAGNPLGAAAFDAARRWVGTPFGQVAVVERGTGPAALFLHGFPLNGYQWRGALERLSAHRRCIAPDFLGLGHTRVRAGQGVAPAAQADMLAALLDTLGIDRADLVSNDSGSAVAQLFLAHHPQRVRSLLLTNGDSAIECPPEAMQPVISLSKQGRYVKQWLAPWLADGELARSAQGLGGMTYTHPQDLTDETIRMYLEPLVRNAAQTEAYALALERNALADIEPALKRSTVPARIVWGTGDTIFSPRNATYLTGILGSSQGVRRVHGAKLFFPEEFPDLIAQEARRLWGVAQPEAGGAA